MAICKRIFTTINSVISLIFITFIRFYQFIISPIIGKRCRFYPTCSEYTLQAIKFHGIWIGLWLMSKRLVKCHPGCEGGFDPIPKNKKVENK